MTRDELFEIWAPRGGRWSPWAKPVLFAHADPVDEGPPPAPPAEAAWWPEPRGVALVLDLPGAAGVSWGLAAAQRGFRPVPLFNALPGPAGTAERVPVREIARALAEAALALRDLPLADDAPPVFLMDAQRRGGTATVVLDEGDFDNRSVSFPTDFPSANLLRSSGVARAVVVQPSGQNPQPDLLHTLVRWQDGGVAISVKALDQPGDPAPVALHRPRWPRLAVYRMLELLGLHRGLLGGFGGTLEEGAFG